MAYGYVAGNPLRWVDPMGLCGWWSNFTNAVVDVGHQAAGTVEAGLTMATGLGAYIGGGVASLGTLVATGGDVDASEVVRQEVQNTLTYRPYTPYANYYMDTLEEGLTSISISVVGSLIDEMLPTGSTASGYVTIGGEILYQSSTGNYNDSAMFGAVTGSAAAVVATGVVVTAGAPILVGGVIVAGSGIAGGYIGSVVYGSFTPPKLEVIEDD